DDLLVLDVHALPAADRAVGADALHHPVGGGRACGGVPRGGGGDRRAAPEHIAGAQLPDDRPLQRTPACHGATIGRRFNSHLPKWAALSDSRPNSESHPNLRRAAICAAPQSAPPRPAPPLCSVSSATFD